MIKYEIIKKFAQVHPEKPALCDENTIITWHQFLTVILSMTTFIQKNIQTAESNSCLFISRNSLDIVLLGSAFSTLGIPFQGLDYHLGHDIIASLISQLGTKHIFISKEFKEKYAKLTMVNVYVIEDFVALAKQHVSTEKELVLIEPALFKSYSFTSGTTQHPKIVYRTQSFDKRRFDYLQSRYKFNNGDNHLTCLPMYHVSSLGWLRLFLNLGCSVVIHDFNKIYNVCELLYRYAISTVVMSPIMLKQLLSFVDKKIACRYLDNLKFLLTGGRHCSVKLKKTALSILGPIIYEYYGTTETGINTLLDPCEAELFPGSVGQEIEGTKILIIDRNNVPVPTNNIGKIAIHSYMNMDVYLNAPDKFIFYEGEKYVLTSDYGYKNSNGYLYIVQRKYDENNDDVYDVHAIENGILDLDYIEDVFVKESQNLPLQVNFILSRFCPYEEIERDIQTITNKYGIHSVTLNQVSALHYTKTGKMNNPTLSESFTVI